MMQPSDSERRMYLPVEGQYGLPFAEAEFKEEDDHAVVQTWDKNLQREKSGPNNYAIHLQYESRADITEWLKQIRGRYSRYDGGSVIVFERESDYIFAKMSFKDVEFLGD